MVSFRYDEPEYSPAEVAARLTAAAGQDTVATDSYSLGGSVSQLERAMAARLGKERAVFMPTGTLANHLALRALAREGRRILVQEQSHIYQDAGDALTTLSGFNLIPLGRERASFTLEEAQGAYAAAAETRVRTAIGALAIESPVRRRHGEAVEFGSMREICAWARLRGIGTHLDGARLFIASRYTGVSVQDYASLFDTVYVSLYKYFGSASGAILAGPAALLDGIYHERRMFGGGLNQAWIFAALALEGLSRFEAEFDEAVRVSEELIRLLAEAGPFGISRIPGGTNIFALELVQRAWAAVGPKTVGFAAALRSRGILLPEAVSGRFYLKVNASLRGRDPGDLLRDFLAAAGGA